MKKTYKGYGLTPVGLQEYRAFLEAVNLYFAYDMWAVYSKAAYRWAEAAEKAYARDPEEFVLTGIANGQTRRGRRGRLYRPALLVVKQEGSATERR